MAHGPRENIESGLDQSATGKKTTGRKNCNVAVKRHPPLEGEGRTAGPGWGEHIDRDHPHPPLCGDLPPQGEVGYTFTQDPFCFDEAMQASTKATPFTPSSMVG